MTPGERVVVIAVVLLLLGALMLDDDFTAAERARLATPAAEPAAADSCARLAAIGLCARDGSTVCADSAIQVALPPP